MWGRIRNVIQPTWAPPLFGTLNIIFSLFFRAEIARSHKWTWCCYRPTRMARQPHILEFGSNQTAARTITVAEGFV